MALAQIEPPTAATLVAAASIERNSGDLRKAAALLDRALGLDPSNPVARSGRARIAVDTGEPDAGARYREVLAAEPDNRELLLGSIAATESAESRKEALARVSAVLAVDPAWYEGHRILSAALWEQGARDSYTTSFETAIAARPRDPLLWKDYIAAFSKADDFAAAADACHRASATIGDPAFDAAEFGYRSAAGDMAEADIILARLPPGMPGPVALAKHRLRQRDLAAAEVLLASATAADPNDIEAWALRGIGWQLNGNPRFDWLNGQPGLVGVDELPLSAAQIADIADRLRAIHQGCTIRAGQSVRGGTQTAGNLFDRLEPEIGLLHNSIRGAVERHRNAMPPADPSHPVLRHRERPFAFAGSWSIRLTDGGFHVHHMHPKGILSAASYWAVPETSGSDPQAGWLEIGGAPAYLALDMKPFRLVEPRPGRLVLFPSTLHHGTRPFPAGERISVAFDVVGR